MPPIIDTRGMKFKISAIHTAAQHRMFADKFAATAAKLGLTQESGPMVSEVKVLNLDEALAYFIELKKIQDYVEERERAEGQAPR
jgi:hypothetical protein